ncbi:MAG: 2-hydroxyacid dehydrogenase [Candidatus Eremiobacteraeota bacterium]|nr:2-hydroxyacid dehydrogenase [Candidatus Eremiobacteraeota bacterium]
MNILFCDEGYSEARRRLARELPGATISAAPPTAVLERLCGVDVIVPYMARIDARIIDAGSFGLIQQFGVGLEGVDVEAATRAGVWVARVPGAGTGNPESVAEHALFLMLALARRFPHTQEHVRARRLGEPAGLALSGKTACIVGVGSAGAALAIRLHAMGMRVIAVRKNLHGTLPSGLVLDRTFPLSELTKAVGEADFVVVTARYEPDAHHLIGRETLAAMKPGAFIVNVARGGFIDRDALANALRSGRLAGAGLDVVEAEPIPATDPLLALGAIVTPHVAGVTDVSYEGIARAVAENVRRYARGEAPLNAVNAPLSARSSMR